MARRSAVCQECIGKSLREDYTTVAECILTFNMGKFVSLCSTGDTECVRNKMPKLLLEAAKIQIFQPNR